MMYIKRFLAIHLSTYSFAASSTILSVYLTRNRAREELVNFCQDVQTQKICDNYSTLNFPNQFNQTADAQSFVNYPSITVMILLLAGVLGMAHILSPTAHLVPRQEEKKRSYAKVAGINFMLSLFPAVVFSGFALLAQYSLIYDLIHDLCPIPSENGRDLTKNCTSTFSSLNKNELDSLDNLFDQLYGALFQIPQFLVTLSAGLTIFLMTATTIFCVFKPKHQASVTQEGRLFCCKRRSEQLILNADSSDELNVEQPREKGYGTFAAFVGGKS